jgi:hypothetical protein
MTSYIWECPKKDCLTGFMRHDLGALARMANEHLHTPGHEQWRDSINPERFAPEPEPEA